MPSLGNDLAAIRKKRGLSLDEIQQSTKIPKKILESIENNSIFKSKGGDNAYIRGYVRSFARALSIEERDIVFALNKVAKNSYSGSLIDDKDRPEIKDVQNKSDDNNGSDSEEDEQPHPLDASLDKEPADSDDPILKPDNVHTIDWADMGYQFQPAKKLRSKRNFTLPLILLVVAVAVFSAYWFYFRTSDPTQTSNNSKKTSPTQTTTTSSDSLQLGLKPSTNGDSAGGLTGSETNTTVLPDTLSIVLYAAYDKLEPIRVYTDIADELNPYWIEQGEAIEFKFVNSFQFRNNLNSVILLMNGHRISNLQDQFLNSQSGRIEINRSFFEQDPKWLQPQPDTLALDVPPPSVIRQIEPQN